ncbi:MAG: beta-propeller fold lactonase family protein [Acidobacteriota bacterium]
MVKPTRTHPRRLPIRWLAGVALGLLLVPPASARLPEPDHIFYGRALRGGEPVEQGLVEVFLDGQATPLSSYILGTEGEVGQRYVLRVPIDSVDPQLAGTARPGDAVTFTIDGVFAGEGVVGALGEAQILDLDELAALPGLSIDDVTVIEGDTGSVDAIFTVTLSETSLSAVSVDYETPSGQGTATQGLDYTLTSGTVTIDPGDTEGTITVPILGDFEEEADETFVVQLSNESGAILSDAEGDGTIVDNERPPDVAIGDVAVLEGDAGSTLVELTLVLSRPITPVVTVQWSTTEAVDGATADVDFAAASGTATFASETTTTTLMVEVFGDVEDESDELFYVDLDSVSAEATISDGQAEVVIWDDDGFLEFVEAVGLGTMPGLDEASAVAVTPGGGWIVVSGKVNDSLLTFARDAVDGSLTFADQISEGDDGGNVVGLDGPEDIVVSPDGAHVYVASFISSAVSVFALDGGSGALSFLEAQVDGAGGVDGLLGASSLAFDSTGDFLYVAGETDDAVAVFERDETTGLLTFVEAHFDSDDAVDGLGLDGATAVAVSADDAHVYVASRVDSAVAVFGRDGSTGELTAIEFQSLAGGPITGLGGTSSVAVSGDGEFVYATGASEDGLVVFRRDDASGALTWLQTLLDDVNGADGLDGATEVVVSFDTRVVFTAALEDDALGVFLRDPSTGSLSPIEFHFDGSGGEDGLDRALHLAVSANDSSIYLVGSNDDAVAVYLRDSIQPTDPVTLESTSHTENVWSNLSQIVMEWSGAVDNAGGTGVLGYSFLFDLEAVTMPDLILDLTHTVDAHTTQSVALPDDDGFYFHIRTCDFSANCTSAIHRGPYRIDATAPAAPADLASPSHGSGAPEADDTIDVTWTAASDNLSGVAGYSAVFDRLSDNTCGESENLGPVVSWTSPVLADGTWYFHLCAVDEAGNWSDPMTLGPLVVEASAPRLVNVDTVAGTGDGELSDGEMVDTYSITQLLLAYSEEMENGGGGTGGADVTNPDNYLLVHGGPDGVLQTLGCGPLAGDDLQVPVDSVAFDSITFGAVAGINGGIPLPAGAYGLYSCSALTDLFGTALDGDGDGSGGDDAALGFSVGIDNLLANPNLDGDLSPWVRFPDTSSVVDFAADDADEAASSGSAEVTFSGLDPVAYVSQCVAIDAALPHELRGRARIDGGSGSLPIVSALVRYFASPNCTIDQLDEESSAALAGDTLGVWESFELPALTIPATAQSARVFFLVDGTGATTYEAFLDNLVLAARPNGEIFTDGFESGNVSAWSAAVE